MRFLSLFSTAPVKIAKCLHLSVASPAASGIATTSKDTTSTEQNDKSRRHQPWELLKGNFKPAGSRTSETLPDKETHSTEPDDRIVAIEQEQGEKKDKKRKEKADGDKEDKKKTKKPKKE